MKKIIAALFAGTHLIQKSFTSSSSQPDESWFIGKGHENGVPLLIRVRKQMPEISTRQNFSWLAIISWEYFPKANGMPEYEEHRPMEELENKIESKLTKPGFCLQAINRLGNGKKEWKYYIRNREQFMEAFNKAIKGKVDFPIEINFYHDPEWQELNTMLKTIKK